MDLLNLGSLSRKTHIRPRENLSKDKYNMEDIDEFFSDEDNAPKRQVTSRKNIASRYEVDSESRRMNFTEAGSNTFNLSATSTSRKLSQKTRKSPLGSPLPDTKKHESSDDEISRKATKRRSNIGPSKILDNQNKPNRNHEDIDRSENDYEDFGNDNDYGDFDNDFENDYEPSADPSQSTQGTQSTYYTQSQSRAEKISRSTVTPVSLSPVEKVPKNKRAGSLTKSMALGKTRRPAKASQLTQDSDEEDSLSPRLQMSTAKTGYVVRASPLPSPPPDGLRRSRRTKIAPLAYWRNERIVYTRAYENNSDGDTTLAEDIKKIPLQEIKEVVHYPEIVEEFPQHQVKKRQRATRKSKKDKDEYDYESDPEIPGSEWFVEGEKTVGVIEGNSKVPKLVAYTPDGVNYITPRDAEPGLDNFRVAPLFENNKDLSAAGIIEFPFEGVKMLKDSGEIMYNFHVVKGLIEVVLNGTRFVVTRGCSFQVPSRNTYGFKNVGNTAARLFFVQTRVIEESDDEL